MEMDPFTVAPTLKAMYREDEVRQVKQLLHEGCSVVVHGEAGVGKHSLVQEVVQQIWAPVVTVDTLALVPQCRNRSQLLKCIDELVDTAVEMRALLYVPHIEMLKIIEDGECESLFSERDIGGRPKLLGSLCARVGRGDVQCVATTTAYGTMLGRVSAFFGRFTAVRVAELSSDKTAATLCANRAKLSIVFGQHVGVREIVCAVRLTDKYFTRQQLPAKAVELLEEVCNSGRRCSVEAVVRRVAEVTSLDASRLHKEVAVAAPTSVPSMFQPESMSVRKGVAMAVPASVPSTFQPKSMSMLAVTQRVTQVA